MFYYERVHSSKRNLLFLLFFFTQLLNSIKLGLTFSQYNGSGKFLREG
ncbi:hypothetical protein GGR98_000872 [Parageobacillus caldoxylosilyticus]|jgi:hypothetical protein|nr:hypothetical protein [Parageobacillus caldoxylosilyticus]